MHKIGRLELTWTGKYEDYEIEPKQKSIHLTESGTAKAEKFYNIENLFRFEPPACRRRRRTGTEQNAGRTYGKTR